MTTETWIAIGIFAVLFMFLLNKISSDLLQPNSDDSGPY